MVPFPSKFTYRFTGCLRYINLREPDQFRYFHKNRLSGPSKLISRTPEDSDPTMMPAYRFK